MNGLRKRQAVLLIILVSAAILLLSVGLSDMQLMPGLPFPSGLQNLDETAPVQYGSESIFLSQIKIPKVIALILLILVVLFAIGLFIHFFSNDFKKLLACLFGLTIIIMGLFFLMPQSGSPLNYQEEGIIGYAPPEFNTSPLGEPPPLVVWLVVGGLLLATGTLALILFRKILHNTHTKELFLQEAEDALSAIRSGEDFKNVIIRCYLQMGAALQAEQGIQHEDNLTTREFEELLESKGVARDPVHRLTRLFEAARYGHKPASLLDEQNAVDCLNQILQTYRKSA